MGSMNIRLHASQWVRNFGTWWRRERCFHPINRHYETRIPFFKPKTKRQWKHTTEDISGFCQCWENMVAVFRGSKDVTHYALKRHHSNDVKRFHHNNVSAHRTAFVHHFLTNINSEVVPCTWYLPELASSDFHFILLKDTPWSHIFNLFCSYVSTLLVDKIDLCRNFAMSRDLSTWMSLE